MGVRSCLAGWGEAEEAAFDAAMAMVEDEGLEIEIEEEEEELEGEQG